MRIINKMKKTMLVLAALLFTVNVAFAETITYDFKNWPDKTVGLEISDEEIGTAWETGNSKYQKIYRCITEGLENFAFQAVYVEGGSASKGTWLRHEKGLMNYGATRSMAILGLKTGDVVTITAGVVDFTGGGNGDGTWTVETIEGGYIVTMTADGNLGMCIAKNDYIYSIAITSGPVAEPEPAVDEVVVAANFDDGNNPFFAWTGNTRTVKDGVLEIVIPAVTNAWDEQMAYDNTFELDATYTMKFKVKGSAAGSISANFQVASGSYPNAGDFGAIEFGTEWTAFEKSTVVTLGGANRLIFNLGSFEGTVYMDDFELTVVHPENVAPKNWVSVITNGDFEGTETASFVVKENGGDAAGAFVAPTITDGIGKDSKGIKVKSFAGAANDWDAQFWIAPSKALAAGVEYRVAFDYRATAAVTVGTQAHDAPGAYKHNDAIGSVAFTTEWQHFEKTGYVSADYASVAFNLSVDKENDVEFFFDNVTFEVVEVTPALDFTAYDASIEYAKEKLAALDPEADAMLYEAISMLIEENEAFKAEIAAATGDEAWLQEDVDRYAEGFKETIDGYIAQAETEKLMAKVEEARIAGEEALNSYPENLRSDRAGLVNALRGLPRFAMGMTAEMIQEAIDAVYTAIPLYKAENEPITAGTFYMKNVAADKYLVGGNSWGTQASLGAHGLDVIVTRLENGKYSIDTNVPNGAKHYLGSNGYVDSDLAEWTLTKVTGGNYVISLDNTSFIGYDGSTTVVSLTLTDSTAAAAQWQFITKDELIREFANATVDSPVDATFFIQGQNFSRSDNNRNGAWQGGPAFGGGNNTNWCAEKWNANFDIYQELTGLPNGSYRLTAQGFYRAGNGGTAETAQHAMLYAGSKSIPLVNILSEAGNEAFAGGNVSSVEGYGDVPNNMETAGIAFAAGLYAGHSIDVLVTDGTLRIGVKKETLIESDWTIFDNFELAYLGTELYDAVTPLIEIVNEAKAWKAELNAEDEMQAQIIATIDQMIPAAQAVIDNPASQAAVDEMYNSVYMFLFGSKTGLAQYEAQMAQALMATYTEPTDAAGLKAAIDHVFIVSNDLTMNAGNGEYTMNDLDAAVAAMKAAQEAFIVENTPIYKTASVALAANMFKNWDGVGADAQPVADATPEMGVGVNLGAGAMVYGFSTVDYLHYADLTGYEKIVFEGTPGVQLRVMLNRLVHEGQVADGNLIEVNVTIGEDGKAEVDLTGYEFAHLNAIKTGWGSPEGTITSINLVYTPSIAYLCGATETTEAIYTALVNAGYNVTALNYDDVTLTEEIIASDFVGKYDAVVLAGGTGSGANLAKTANLLLGKVNVLSTKAFWYKHYGTNGDNPGTADTPSLGLVKTVAEHPIFAGIEGAEFAVFNDMGKENGRYLQSNGQFADNTPAQKTLATTNGADCIGEAWVDGKGYVIIPVDGAQPEGYLTAAGEALFVNAIDYLLAGTEYVEPTIDVTSITLDQTAVELLEGATVTLVATVAPENATDKTITWTTSNEAVATVANGVVTAVAAGEAVITAQAGNVTATCTITIKADGIEVIGIESTLSGDIYDLGGRLVKKNATSIDGLQKGIYLINGKKVVVK